MTEKQPDLLDLALKEIDREMGIVVLVSGHLDDSAPHYAYALVPPSKYLDLKEAEKQGNYDLAAYGEILKHGEGLTPSPEVQKEMKEKYSADNHFEDELNNLIGEIAEG